MDAEEAALRSRLSGVPPRHDRGIEGASAVLVPVVRGPDGLELLFTARGRSLTHHPGELSFPGGRVEAGEQPLAAALREAREEVGVAPDRVEVLGHLADYVSFRGQTLHAYVGLVAVEDVPDPWTPNPEVEGVLLLLIRRLLDPETPRRLRHDGREPLRPHPCDVDGYHTRAYEDPPGRVRLIHYWHLLDGGTLWGITADLVALVLARVYDWRPTTAPRKVWRHEDVLP